MKTNEVVELLTKKKQTLATMESCTGGGVANAITNIDGASEVLKFSAITYSNEYKMKMGVPKEIIDKYTVYSQETADAMSKKISDFANSDYGVGITGKLNGVDPANPTGADNLVYISIYERKTKKNYQQQITVTKQSRELNKQDIIRKIMEMLLNILKGI